jgi:phosphoesterase RecJ-like protein
LATLDSDPELGITWMTVPTEVYKELDATPEDLEGMVDIPRSVDGTRVGVLFRLASTGEIKLSFRSNGPVDVNALARKFGGGGHVKASGAMVAGPLDRAIEEVLEVTRKAVRRQLEKGSE